MDSKNIRDLCEAYVAVYDEDLRDDLQELNEIDAQLAFIDNLTDNELDFVVEDVICDLISEGCGIGEIDYLFESAIQDYEELYEGKASDLIRRGREIESRAKNIRNIRLRKSVGRAISGAASEVGRRASAAKEKVTGKLASAKEKIKGFIGRTATDIQAAPGIAKRAAGRVATRLTHKAANLGAGLAQKAADRLKNVAHKTYENGGGESLRGTVQGKPSRFGGTSGSGSPSAKGGNRVPTTRPSASSASSASSGSRNTTYRGGGVGRREQVSSGGITTRSGTSSTTSPSSTGRALPPAGAGSRTPGGNPRPSSQMRFALNRAKVTGARRLAKVTPSEDFEILASYILEDLVTEGYAKNIEEALYVFESLSDYQIEEIAESYLAEETETVDLYDVVLEHLLDQGYADTVESAEAIMVNMSEEWRDSILEETPPEVTIARVVQSAIKSPKRRRKVTATKKLAPLPPGIPSLPISQRTNNRQIT